MRKALTYRSRTWLLAAALILAQTAAQACPGCKPVEGAPLSGASIGFGWDILLMLVTIGSLLAGFTYMIAQSCRALAERDRYLAREEAMPTGQAG